MNWIPYGPGAALLRFADELGDEAFALSRKIVAVLERNPPPGLIEFVPAFTTVLLEFDLSDGTGIEGRMAGFLQQLEDAIAAPIEESRIVDVPVIYDGPDLGRVAEWNKISVDDTIALHSAAIYKVYMLGFSPGFPYLGDLDPRLHTPRLASPRPLVRAGSVGIGGQHTGIYSVDSPGGWNVIGHTPVRLFDIERGRTAGRNEEMFLLRAGDRVRFVRQ